MTFTQAMQIDISVIYLGLCFIAIGIKIAKWILTKENQLSYILWIANSMLWCISFMSKI